MRSLFSADAFLFVLLLSVSAIGQILSSSDTTATPAAGAHDYINSHVETVNPANGSTSIRISVRMPQGRQLAVPFSFAYDSNGAFYIGQLPTGGGPGYLTIPTTVNSQGGWSYTYPGPSWRSAPLGYTVGDIARLLRHHNNTVREWIGVLKLLEDNDENTGYWPNDPKQ